MKRSRFLYPVLALAVMIALGFSLVLLETFNPKAGPTSPGQAHSADEEIQAPPEEDPWETAWANQQQYLQDISNTTNQLRKDLPEVARKLNAKVTPYEQETRRLFLLASTQNGNPWVLEAIDRRIASTGTALNTAMAPVLALREEVEDLLNKVSQLEKSLPKDKEQRAAASPEMRAFVDTVTQVKKKLSDILARLDNALTAGRVLSERITTANKKIDEYLPILWQKNYLAPPVRYLEPTVWTDMPTRLEATIKNFSLRMPMELPQTQTAWRKVGTTFATLLLFGGLLTVVLYRRLSRNESGAAFVHIFRTSLPWICVGSALMVASISVSGEIFRVLLIGGNTLLLMGQVSLAWDLRAINTPNLPRHSPLWPVSILALVGYMLMYPGLPSELLNMLWIAVMLAALILKRLMRTKNCPLQYENTILQIESFILWLGLFLSVCGLPRYSILLYMLFVSLAVAIQLGMGALKLIHIAAQHLPETGAKAILGSIVIACTAPAALIIVLVGMGLWILTLPGGVYLIRHYAMSGFSVGTTHFNPMQLLLIISAFYITRTAVSMGSAFLRKMPSQGIKIDSSLIPPLQTAFSYGLWALFGLFVLKALGMELSNLAVVAGGLSVGIGFGMQAIVNNFLSGLILIFSRILQEGDVVEVGSLTGTVRKISVRATTVETYDNAVIYVPNSEFVSNRLINWTRNSRSVRRELTVGVAYGTDTALVMRLLREVAAASPDVLKYPPPAVIFANFGNSTLDFSLRFWVHDFDKGVPTASAIRLEVERVFREHSVEVAFPQMDIHIKEMHLPLKMARKEPPRHQTKHIAAKMRPRRGKPRIPVEETPHTEKTADA